MLVREWRIGASCLGNRGLGCGRASWSFSNLSKLVQLGGEHGNHDDAHVFVDTVGGDLSAEFARVGALGSQLRPLLGVSSQCFLDPMQTEQMNAALVSQLAMKGSNGKTAPTP